MNNALNTFSYEFQDKIALERRAESLESSIEFFEDRINRLSGGVTRSWRTRRLNRVKDRLAAAQDELDFINDELTFYNDVPEQSRDEFNIALSTSTLGNGRAWAQATVSIDDSLFDETFVSGDQLNVRAWASKPRKSSGTRFKTFDIDINDGDGGKGSYVFGSTRLGRMATKYDTLTIGFFDDDGNTIHSQEWDVTNIV